MSAKNLSIKFTLALLFLAGVSVGCTRAQTIDLSTKEAVIEQLEKQSKVKFSKDLVCIERLKESAKIIVIGFFRYDYGCHLEGAFVNSVYIEEGAELTQKALNGLGWKKANQVQREKLALTWIEKGLLAFSTVLYTKDKDFKDGEFQPPIVASKDDGEITVTLWTSVMRRKIEFHHLKLTFTKDGTLLENKLVKRTRI